MAFFAACLFAVHPVHTDSVAYISGRRDILSTLFYLLGFYFFLLSRQRQKTRLLIPALVSYLLAISSKEMAVTLPAIFFLYDGITNLPEEGSLFKRCSASLKKIISRYGFFYLFFLTIALLFTGYKVFIKSPSNKIGFYGGDPFIQFLTVGKILVHYIKLLFYPVNLLADYSFNSFPLSQSLFEPATLLSLAVLCTLGFLAVKLLVIDKLMAFAVVWFFVTLLPVCHIFPHHELLAEHYLYLPSFGFVLLAGLLFERLLTAFRWQYAAYALFAIIILLLSARTVYRNYDWKNSFTLWGKTIKTSPDCVRALNNLGIEYFKRKDYTRAEQLYRRALSLQPVYEKAVFNLGNLYRIKEDYNTAISMYQKAARLNPENFRNHNNLGNALAMTKKFDQAVQAYKNALKHNPDYPEANNNLGNVYRSLGKVDQAITHYQKAIELEPFYSDAYTNLISVYTQLGQPDRSIQLLEQARRKNPFVPFVQKKLAIEYERTAQYDKAIKIYGNVLKLEPDSLDPHLNLANIYLKQLNDKQKALYHLKVWIRKAPEDKRADTVRKMIDQIEAETGN